MNSSEIKKGLECCSDIHFCSVCPYYLQNKENDYCKEDMSKDALAYINQLEAEVERLEKENSKLSNEVEYLLTKRLSGEDKTAVMAMCCETLEKIRQDLQITEIKRTIQDLKIAIKFDRDFEDIMNGTYEQRKEGDD